MFTNPRAILRVLGHVGPAVVLSWCAHYAMLLLYTAAHAVLSPLLGRWAASAGPRAFWVRRLLEALKYGSASDYVYHAAAGVPSAGACGAPPAAAAPGAPAAPAPAAAAPATTAAACPAAAAAAQLTMPAPAAAATATGQAVAAAASGQKQGPVASLFAALMGRSVQDSTRNQPLEPRIAVQAASSPLV